jgi:Zn-finger nucleic acid-binding protein
MLPGFVPDDRGGGPVIQIDGCAKCGATWFDGGELERIAAKTIVDLFSGDAAAARRCWQCGATVAGGPGTRAGPSTCPRCQARTGRTCPGCGTRMGVLEHSAILVDACPTCRGIFLDRGEFDQILALPGDPLKCVRCGSTEFEARHSYFSEQGILCGPCHATEAAVARGELPAGGLAAVGGAGAPIVGPATTGPSVKRIDVTRFLAEYLRLRNERPPDLER